MATLVDSIFLQPENRKRKLVLESAGVITSHDRSQCVQVLKEVLGHYVHLPLRGVGITPLHKERDTENKHVLMV